MSLKYLAERCKGTFGLEHVYMLRILRAHLKKISDEDFEREVSRIRKPDLLRIFWEAGLTSRRQQIVLKRLEEIMR